MVKRKYINGEHWDWVEESSYKMTHVEDIFSGYLSLIQVEKVKKTLVVDYGDSSVCLFDNGYKCLVFLPDQEKWCLSVIYDTSDEVVEWYFDMTKQNSVDERGIPFYDDLYLDIAIAPNFKVKILDEDELLEALENHTITEQDYRMAYDTCTEVINEVIPNKAFLCDFFNRYLKEWRE